MKDMTIFHKNPLLSQKYHETSLRFPIASIYFVFICILVFDHPAARNTLTYLSFTQGMFLAVGYLGMIGLEVYEALHFPRPFPFPVRLSFFALRLLVFLPIIFLVDSNLLLIPAYALFMFSFAFDFGILPSLILWSFPIAVIFTKTNAVFTLTAALGMSDIQLSVMMCFAILISYLLVLDQRTRQHNLALHRRLEADVANSFSQAKQEERERISRDLHDSLGHYLVAINLQLQKAVAYRAIDSQESEKAISQAQMATNDAIRDLRSTLSNLRQIDTPVNYRDDVQALIEGVQANGTPVTYTITGSEEGFSDFALITLRQVVQEGLTNIQKHAQASQVELNIHFKRKGVNFWMKDNGIGFSPERVDVNQHYGLAGLQERIELAQGWLKVRSQKNQGTTLTAFIPKRQYQ